MALVSIAMYDFQEIRPAAEIAWSAMADALRAEGVENAPDSMLVGDAGEALVSRDDFLFSQCCGIAFAGERADAVRPFMALTYSGHDDRPGRYRSRIVVRTNSFARGLEDLRGLRCAINCWHSHSGSNVLRHTISEISGDRPFFGSVSVSGSHFASLEFVRAGVADAASIDSVTFDIVSRIRPAAVAGLRVLTSTVPAPAPPLVVPVSTSDETVMRLRAGIRRALREPAAAEAFSEMTITGAVDRERADYEEIVAMDRDAVSAGVSLAA